MDFRDSKTLSYYSLMFFKNSKCGCSVICRSIRAAGRQGLEPGLGLPETRWPLCEPGRVPPPPPAWPGWPLLGDRVEKERVETPQGTICSGSGSIAVDSGRGASVGPVCPRVQGAASLLLSIHCPTSQQSRRFPQCQFSLRHESWYLRHLPKHIPIPDGKTEAQERQ